MKRMVARILIGLVLLLVVVVLGGAVWLGTPQPLLPEATAVLRSTDAVRFSETGDWLAFEPVQTTRGAGLIWYPGGKVSAEGYAPAAQAIAAQGYPVWILKLPLNSAFLGIDKAAGVQRAHPEIMHWAVGGHSLGGVGAAEFAKAHPDAVQGLVFWAAYPADSNNLSSLPLRVLSIYGTLDAGAADMASPKVRALLPASTQFVPIAGGNHEQMGYYTGQANDPPAQIARSAQQAEVVQATVELLAKIAGP